MKLTCPGCGFAGEIEAYLNDAAARGALLAALKLPAPLSDRLLRYLQLFRPAERALTWDRAERLLGELLQMIGEARVTRNGRTWAAPLPLWEAALEQILAKRSELQLPLKTHGYLLEIAAGMASHAVAQAEIAREQRAAYPYARTQQPGADTHVRRSLRDSLQDAGIKLVQPPAQLDVTTQPPEEPAPE